MREKTWFMALVLGLVSAIAGVALYSVRSFTKPIIDNAILEEKIKPSLTVFFETVEFDNDYIEDRVNIFLGKDDKGRKQYLQVFKVKKGGQLIGAALQTSAAGYGGQVEVLTAFDLANKKILGVKTVAQSETKGLGARIANDAEPFIQQWNGVSFEGGVQLEANGGEIDGISGATFTSTAFTAAVDNAIGLLKTHRQSIEQEGGQ